MDKKIIFFAGNPLLNEDSIPFRIVPILEKKFPNIKFQHHDPNENLLEPKDGKLIIIDTVINAGQVITITDPDRLSTESVYSPHDWDLALNLKLLLRLGVIKSFLIIGLPPTGKTEIISEKVIRIIQELPGSIAI